MSNAFGISSVPTMFLVEPDGAISRVIEGWRKRDIEWLGGQAGVAGVPAGRQRARNGRLVEGRATRLPAELQPTLE